MLLKQFLSRKKQKKRKHNIINILRLGDFEGFLKKESSTKYFGMLLWYLREWTVSEVFERNYAPRI
jgi:hypothetical protein